MGGKSSVEQETEVATRNLTNVVAKTFVTKTDTVNQDSRNFQNC